MNGTATTNRNQRLLLGASFAAAIAVCMGGCGGDDGTPAQPPSRQLVGQPPQIDQGPGPGAMPGGPGGMPGPGGPGGSGGPGGMPGDMHGGMGPMGQQKPEPKTKRPEDVSKWKTTDYFSAKKENDQLLLAAVQNIAQTKRYVGNEKIALVLIKLLTAEEPKKDPKKDAAKNARPGGPGMGGPGMEPGMGGPGMGMEGGMGGPGMQAQVPRLSRETIVAVVGALASNGSKPAKKSLRDVVLGTLKTDDDSIATPACLQALVADMSAENEAVLFRVLTDAEKLPKFADKKQPGNAQRPGMGGPGMGMEMMPGGYGGGYGAGGTLTPDALRQMTLRLVEPIASESFREKLAKHSLASKMTPAAFTAISGMLMKPHPDNVGPQLMLFLSDKPTKTTKAKLAAFFADYSGTALGHYLGVYKQKKIHKPVKQAAAAQPGAQPAKTGWGQQTQNTGWGNQPRPGQAPGMGDPMGEGGMMGPGMGAPGYGGMAAVKSTKELMATDPHMPTRIAGKLWSPATARIVGIGLAQAASLNEAAMVIPLARTMPVDDVRARLHRVMQAHWKGGSRAFLSNVQLPAGGGRGMGGPGMGMEGMGGPGMGMEGGMEPGMGGPGMGGPGMGGPGMGMGQQGGQFNLAMYDPGFLVLVKMLPLAPDKKNGRSSKKPSRANQAGRMGEGGMGGPGMGGPGMGMGGPGMGGMSPIADWQKVHDDLLYRFCAAFSAAAKNKTGAAVVGTLPIELHTDKNIVARYDVKWPDSAPKSADPKGADQKLDQIEIHYVRIAETGDPGKVWKAYNRALKTQGRMLQQGKVALLDTVKQGLAPDRKLSVDVLITRLQPGTAQPTDRKSKKKPGEPLVIEILTIEIKDPNPPAPKPAEEKNPAEEKSAKAEKKKAQ